MKDRSIYAWMLVAVIAASLGRDRYPVRPSSPSPPVRRRTAAPAAAEAGDGQDRRNLPAPLPDRAGPTGPCAAMPAVIAPGLRHWTSPWSLKAAPAEPTDVRFPINLATALRLSDARPLIVAAAQAEVWVAEAELTRAKVLWLPDLNIGFDYIRHDGGGPGLQQGHHDRAEHELLLRRCRPVGEPAGDHPHDRCHLPAPGRPGRS